MITKEKIKLWRWQNGYTQYRLGELLGVHESTICRIEKGTRGFSEKLEWVILKKCKGIEKIKVE